MPFNYKKEYKELYLPPQKPTIVDVPPMNYIAVRGKGDPNVEGGAYKEAIGLLYAIAFTIKMSKKGGRAIEGYFDYVVPPLEGFWWQEGAGKGALQGVDASALQQGGPGAFDYAHKEDFHFVSCIRLPDFVTEEDFAWAMDEATQKKGQDFSKVEFLPVHEGLCVQCMHIGPYDDEPATIERMHTYAEEQGYRPDITAKRLHHEIYLSDPRRCAPERLKTVVRHPIA